MEPTNQPQPLPEKAPESSLETPVVSQVDRAPVAPPSTPAVAQPVAQVSVVPPLGTPTPVAPTPVPTATGTPATADDVDVIEKEWVDAAQAVVAKNAEDPHAEEEGFEDLQVDYLKKRYGKDIKSPGE